ncbi:MAG TPA: hypothetical protein VGS22_27340 [Thermoanaerobaculia bacterium]|jgi:hypothetical protein|nr:hypothetical protein [Thermoanaerobaculia bacterium]
MRFISSYSDQVDMWQSLVNNIQEMLSSIPGAEAPFAELREKVEALRTAHDSILAMRGRQHESVLQRRTLSREARRAVRRISAIARGQLGFDNPILDTFGVRSEDPKRRNRKEAAPPRSSPQA